MSEAELDTSEIDGVVIGASDRNRRRIVDVYSRQSGRYAVYQTTDRVIVLYADDPLVQRIQRRRLAQLATLRSELDGSLMPWRAKDPKMSRLYQTAREFDMRIGSALIEALEGNIESASAILMRVQTDLANEMASRARLSYLAWTLASAVLILAATFALRAFLAALFADNSSREAVGALAMPAAIRAGVFGAVYSIALGIHRRGLKSDLRRYDYFTDSFVRVGIGALAAFVLGCFLLTGALRIEFGTGIAPTRGGSDAGGIYLPTWPVWMIFGFLAGFTERLVPDLLNSYALKSREPEPPPAVPASTAVAAGAQGASAQDDRLPASEDEVVADPSANEDVDGCDVTSDDHATVTDDENLPPASGGVATR